MGFWKRFTARRRQRQRAIFRYWDGQRERAIDPAVAYRGLQTHPKYDPRKHPALAEAGDLESLDIMLGAIREVFGLSPLVQDEQGRERGLTDRETLDLVLEFNDFLLGLKKSTSPTPISPPPTAPPSLASASTTTSVSSDFGSTSGEPKIVEPSLP
jgi:hypothetical protein